MKRLRNKLESIVFAGLKPGGQKEKARARPPDTWLGRQRRRIDNWISGSAAPVDPLYLSNRSTGQKIKSWSVVAIPLLILVGGVALSLSSYLKPTSRKSVSELSPAAAGEKMLPDFKDLKIDSPRELDVVEIRIEKTAGTRLIGIVRNKTAHVIASADVSCDLTDADGTQLGSITGHLDNIPAAASKTFELPLRQRDAAFALVREISTR